MASFFDRITGERQKVAIALQEKPDQVLEFDACLNETHTGSASTTDHPVEAGADMTDHIRREPEELQLVGMVSDTPLLFLASFRAQASVPGGDPQNRAQDAYGFIKTIKDSGQLVQVTTTLRDYANMALVSLSVVRDKDKGKVVEMSITLREIVIATTEQVEAPTPANAARGKKSKQGKKQKGAETAANQAQSSSILSDLFGAF
jgi:hypothetical protein